MRRANALIDDIARSGFRLPAAESNALFHAHRWQDGPPPDWDEMHDRALEYSINHRGSDVHPA